MANSTVVEGALVAHYSRPYDFEDYEGKRSSGISRRLYIVQSFDEEPTEVRLGANDAALYDTVVGQCRFGTRVSLRCDLISSNNKVAFRLVEIVGIADAEKKAS
jgi:hypothetical protein